MIKRTLKLPKRHSFFLFGPRQTGKSTLLNKDFPAKNVIYYNLLQTDVFTRLAANPKIFREEVLSRDSKITHIIINEVQLIPEILNEVHYLIEQPNSPYFCLSGSSARKLKRSQANLLAGRAWQYYLYPLTHMELRNTFSLNKALNLGTLPSVYLDDDPLSSRKTLKTYVETYLKEEIQAEVITRGVGSFLKFLNIAADCNGSIINYSTIARECGVQLNTVKGYFQILEDTLIGFYLLPYANSQRKRLNKHPKFYFFDNGVLRAIQNQLTVELKPQTYAYGRAFENFIITEIIRLATYQEKDYTFSFYRTSNKAEVDLIIETPRKETYAIEIKSSEQPNISALGGLKSFQKICPKAELFCVSNASHKRIVSGISILPWKDVFEVIGL